MGNARPVSTVDWEIFMVKKIRVLKFFALQIFRRSMVLQCSAYMYFNFLCV